MWKNKQIKQRARKSLKANYFTIIMITFLLAFFGIISSESSQFIGMPSTEEIALGQTQHTNKKIEGVNTWESSDIRPGLVSYLGNYFSTTDSPLEIASATMDNFKGSGGFLYNIMYRVDQFIFTHDAAARVTLIPAIAGYLCLCFLLRNILHVGFSRFLMETRTLHENTYAQALFPVWQRTCHVFSIYHDRAHSAAGSVRHCHTFDPGSHPVPDPIDQFHPSAVHRDPGNRSSCMVLDLALLCSLPRSLYPRRKSRSDPQGSLPAFR